MRILMATGGSAHSKAALRFGGHILHAVPASEIPTIVTVIKDETERPRAEAILAEAYPLLEPGEITVHTKIRVGHAAEEIVREAEEGGYDLVLVGERQQHRLMTRFILGATAVRVVEHAPCPVIIAKGKIGPLRRILLCDSGLEDASLLSRFIEQTAALIEGKEEITVLHVMSQISAGPGVSGEQLRAGASELIAENAPEGQLLERDIQLLAGLHVRPRPKVRHGLVVDEILAEARGGNYDLVVIGTNRGAGWRRILLDDLAHQIIVKVDRPVLVVR